MDSDDLREYLGQAANNEFGAAMLCAIALIVSGVFSFEVWGFLFSATFSYVAFDAIFSWSMHIGDGYIKLGLNNEFQTKGHGFLAFFLAIVLGTAIINFATDYLINYAKQSGSADAFVFLLSIFAVMIILVDVEFRFQGDSDS